MGWFASEPKSQLASDGKPTAPDRSSRADCYAARDAFFTCLDGANIIDSVADAEKAETLCASALRAFEGNCAASWVDYFKRRRVMEHKKQQTLEQLRREGAKGSIT